MNWEQKHRRTGLVQVAVMAFWIFPTVVGIMTLRSSGGRALAVVATIAMLAYMAWVIRDSRKITAAKDRDRRRGPDPFLSGRRPNRALGSGPGASERHDNHPIG